MGTEKVLGTWEVGSVDFVIFEGDEAQTGKQEIYPCPI
jgi:hypothetical protein